MKKLSDTITLTFNIKEFIDKYTGVAEEMHFAGILDLNKEGMDYLSKKIDSYYYNQYLDGAFDDVEVI